MITNTLPDKPLANLTVATPETPPAPVPKPSPVETTETSRKVEETTTTTKPAQSAPEVAATSEAQA